MQMLESGDLRKGLKLEFEGEPYVIVQFEFVKTRQGAGFV
jgi:elongation factor P